MVSFLWLLLWSPLSWRSLREKPCSPSCAAFWWVCWSPVRTCCSGFTGIIQSALGNADFIWVIGIEVFIGIMVAFFQKSGAIEAVANKLNEKLHITPRIAQIMGAALGVLVFFSDYFSPLFVGNVMRPITDKAKVSREKLAWLCDCTSAPVCITLPFTSWGVYVAGLVVGFGTFATAEAGQDAVIHSIPFQLYGILTIVMIFLVALGFLPDYGPMKKAEERARTTGKVVADGSTPCCPMSWTTSSPRRASSPTSFCTS